MDRNELKLVNVIIPIYKEKLDTYEALSLRQVCHVLQNYPLTVIKPRGLDLQNLSRQYPLLAFEEFDSDYFTGISGYNRLMMSEIFYQRFTDYKYILIYQLDAYVFRDELKAWCDKGYDYVGAPWLVRPIYSFPLLKLTSRIKKQYCEWFHLPNSQITRFKVGNGGFSLRKVDSHLKAVSHLQTRIAEFLKHSGNHLFNEDVFFSIEVNKHGMNFTYPDYREALRFSFDKYPELCYHINTKRLPFGCHSWYKKRMKKFWFPIILR